MEINATTIKLTPEQIGLAEFLRPHTPLEYSNSNEQIMYYWARYVYKPKYEEMVKQYADLQKPE